MDPPAEPARPPGEAGFIEALTTDVVSATLESRATWADGPLAASADAATLDAHCRSSDLVNFKRPRDYVFVRDIPKSPVGKVLRRKLQAGEYEALPPSQGTP